MGGAKLKALCVFTDLLGNAAMTRALVDALNRIPWIEPTYVIPGAEDYRKFPAPWWARLTNPWQAEFIARQKARPALREDFQFLWVHSWENVVAFEDIARRIPATAVMDSVPSTTDRQLRLRGAGGWKRGVSHWVHDRAFRTAAAQFQFFLPKSSDCAKALERDYGIGLERCFVTLAPQDLEWWAPPPRTFEPPWKLLFVGNDFERKGGDFLLRLFSVSLANDCNLTILSNDPTLASRSLPAGVKWVRGANREQVRQAYWDSHLFVFPTLQDFAPQVLAESAAAGLVSVSSEIDGSFDLVQQDETGLVLPRGTPIEEWTTKIRGLLAEPERLKKMSANARRFAEQRLGLDRFHGLVYEVAELLRAGAEARAGSKQG